MTKTQIQKSLSSLESAALKRACGVNRYSKTTALLYALNITPIELYLTKRKLVFILQLLNNESTNELLSKGIHNCLNDIVEKLGITKDFLSLGFDRYRGLLRTLTMKKLDEIKNKEKIIKESKMVNAVEFLLEHRSPENNDTLQYLLDPRRCGRG